jgi:Flp pilus assembly pilin Flp
MVEALAALIHDESGAEMVEYGIVIALIALVCFMAVRFFGRNIAHLFRIPTGTLPGV